MIENNNILIAVQNPEIRENLSAILSEKGYHVQFVKNIIDDESLNIANLLKEEAEAHKNTIEKLNKIQEDHKKLLIESERSRKTLLNIIEDEKSTARDKELLNYTIDHSVNEIYIFDSETLQFIYVNTGARLNIGYSLEELKEMTPVDFKPEYTTESFRKLLTPLIEKKINVLSFKTIHKRANGSIYPVEVILQLSQYGERQVFLAVIQDITEKLNTESALLESEKWLTKAQETAHLGSWIWNIKENKVVWSDEMKRIFGLDPLTFEGDLTEIINNSIHPDDKEKVDASNLSVINKNKPIPLEYRIIRPDKTIRTLWAEAGELIQDEEGNAVQLSGIILDITERKKSEELLKEKDELFSLFMKHSPVYAYIKEVSPNESKVIQASDNFIEMVGVSGQDMIGKTMHELFSPEFAEKIIKDDWEVATSGKILKIDENLNEKNYTTIKFPINMKGNQLLAGYTIDITDRKKAEESLIRSEYNYRSLTEQAADAIFIANEKGFFTFVNPTACTMTGYTKEELLKLNILEVIDKKELGRNPITYNQLKEGSSLLTERTMIRKDGSSFPVEISVIALSNGRFQGVARDISERKKAEKQIFQQSQDIALINRLHLALNKGTGMIEFGKLLSEEFKRMFDSLSCTMYLIDNSKQHLIMQGLHLPAILKKGIERIIRIKIPHLEVPVQGVSLYYKAIANKKSLLVNDTYAIENMILEYINYAPLPDKLRPMIKKLVCPIIQLLQLHGIIIIPLMAGDEVIALFEVSKKKNWTEEELKRIEVIASQVTSAILRKQTEEAIYENEEKYRKLVENSPDAVLIHVNGIIQFVNDASAKLFEVDKTEDMIGKKIIDLVHPDYQDVVRKRIQKIVEEKSKAPLIEEKLVTLKGNVFDAEVAATPIIIKGQNGVQVVARDITERKQTQDEIKNKNEFIQTVLNNLPIGVALNNINNGEAFYINKKFEEYYGWPKTEMKNIESFFNNVYPDEKYRQELYTRVMTDIQSGDDSRMHWEECKITHKDGSKHIINAVNIPMFDQNTMVSTVIDVTEQKKAEDEIKKLNESLEEKVQQRTSELVTANKELEAFAYSVSHDLRAPLRAINGFTNILMEDYMNKLDDEAKRICSVISDNSKQMGQLIDDLLRFSRYSRAEIVLIPIQMRQMINSVAKDLISPEMQEIIELKINSIPDAMGDTNLIRQIWFNLLSNAIKFSSGKTKPLIEIGSEIKGDNLIYWIKDNGAGFDTRYSDKIFDVFQRLHKKEEFEGTGVGLAIVKRIVQRHGGQIWAEGNLGKGACFYFSLPLKPFLGSK